MTSADPQDVLFMFISKMNLWELNYYTKFIEAEGENEFIVNKQALKELEEIFSEFLTKKERKFGRLVSLSCSEPPEYSPDEEVLMFEETKSKAVFVTQQKHGFKNRFRYTLHFKNSEWKVDRKERFSEYENKWLKVNL